MCAQRVKRRKGIETKLEQTLQNRNSCVFVTFRVRLLDVKLQQSGCLRAKTTNMTGRGNKSGWGWRYKDMNVVLLIWPGSSTCRDKTQRLLSACFFRAALSHPQLCLFLSLSVVSAKSPPTFSFHVVSPPSMPSQMHKRILPRFSTHLLLLKPSLLSSPDKQYNVELKTLITHCSMIAQTHSHRWDTPPAHTLRAHYPKKKKKFCQPLWNALFAPSYCDLAQLKMSLWVVCCLA